MNTPNVVRDSIQLATLLRVEFFIIGDGVLGYTYTQIYLYGVRKMVLDGTTSNERNLMYRNSPVSVRAERVINVDSSVWDC
jgi:hypothetical protein